VRTLTNELEKKINNAGEAIYRINQIYQDLDMLNGNLQELADMLDAHDDKNDYFFYIWNSFPTYSVLDDLKGLLKEIKTEASETLKK
jgi:hypothetical protein